MREEERWVRVEDREVMGRGEGKGMGGGEEGGVVERGKDKNESILNNRGERE